MQRKIIFLIMFSSFCICGTLFAQPHEEEITLSTYYPAPYGEYDNLSTDAMGIGTTNPQEELVVRDAVNDNQPTISISNSGNKVGAIQPQSTINMFTVDHNNDGLFTSVVDQGWHITARGNGYDADPTQQNDLMVFRYVNGTYKPVVTLDYTLAKVGIRTVKNPESALQVRSDGNPNVLVDTLCLDNGRAYGVGAGNFGSAIAFTTTANETQLPSNSVLGRIGAVVKTETTSDRGELVFQTRDSAVVAERMRITHDGNIGVGTANPGYKLVIRDANYPVISLSNSSALNTAQSCLNFFTLDPLGNGLFDNGDKAWHLTARGNTFAGGQENDLILYKYDSAWVGPILYIDFPTNNIGIGAAPNAHAILDLTSTTKGFLLPRMTQAQRKAIAAGTPPIGLMVYQTDAADPGIHYYNGTKWKKLTDVDSS